MATAKFRHANSPDEIAKRETLAAAGVKEGVKGFRHYNHPEEVAARARAQTAQNGGRGAQVDLPSIPLPPPPERVLALPPSGVLPGPRLSPPIERLLTLEHKVAELEARLEQRVDQALADLFGTPAELQDLRVTIANLPAIQEQALDLRNRVRALENTWDAEFSKPEPKTNPELQKPPAPPEPEQPAPAEPAPPVAT